MHGDRTTKFAWAENSRVCVRRSRLRRSTVTSSLTLASSASTTDTVRANASAGGPSSSCKNSFSRQGTSLDALVKLLQLALLGLRPAEVFGGGETCRDLLS